MTRKEFKEYCIKNNIAPINIINYYLSMRGAKEMNYFDIDCCYQLGVDYDEEYPQMSVNKIQQPSGQTFRLGHHRNTR